MSIQRATAVLCYSMKINKILRKCVTPYIPQTAVIGVGECAGGRQSEWLNHAQLWSRHCRQMSPNRGPRDPWECRWTPSKPGHTLDLAGKRCPPFHLRGANLQGNVLSSMQTRERRILLPTSGKSGQAYAVNIKTASQKVRLGSHISLSVLTVI